MNTFTTNIQLVYVLAAACFVVGLHLMNSPATARRGNQVSTAGMAIAVIVTLVLLIHDGSVTGVGWTVLIVGALLGSVAGLYSARTVQMTAMPQLVSMFNAVGGGAAALVAVYEYIHDESAPGGVLGTTSVFTVLDVIIGSVTFTGSLIAAGKLQGLITGQPIIFRGGRVLNAALAVIALGTGAFMFTTASLPALLILVLASLAFGVMMVLPIGGADMPVVISLLNAFTGTAVAMAGFVVGNWALIVAGRARRRVRRDPHQADGRRDEPLPRQHHHRRVRHRGQRGGRGGGGRRPDPVDRRRRRGDPARLRVQGDHRARLRPGRRPGAARRRRAGVAARVAGHRGVLRDPPGRRPDARPHERAARRGQRAVPAAEGDGRDQPGVRRGRTWRW